MTFDHFNLRFVGVCFYCLFFIFCSFSMCLACMVPFIVLILVLGRLVVEHLSPKHKMKAHPREDLNLLLAETLWQPKSEPPAAGPGFVLPWLRSPLSSPPHIPTPCTVYQGNSRLSLFHAAFPASCVSVRAMHQHCGR